MGNVVHPTRPVKVWADVDIRIAALVEELNGIEGVRTHASCQGTIGEGGAEPYPAEIMVSWHTEEAKARLEAYGLRVEGDGHGMVYPSAELLNSLGEEPPDLISAARKVLDGLLARIDAAPKTAVPVFIGIAELHAALLKAETSDGR